jgi:transposase
MTAQLAEVTLGVDTHADNHVAVLIDPVGRVLATTSIETTAAGYRQLVSWARRHGELRRAGVEGTGAYGAGLARALVAAGVEVFEVNRPNRQQRRRRGKSDPTDAEAAARAVLSGDATAVAKTHDGIVEAIRVLRVARRSALKARTQVTNQIRDVILTAPEQLRAELRGLSTRARVERCAGFRPDRAANATSGTKRALRHLARRYQHLTDELAELDTDLKTLIEQAAPRTLAHHGVGPDVAGALLVTAGDNPDRLANDAALAALCGASPVEASSGKVIRHRLNRGGDRRANNALWRIAMVRMSTDSTTRAYVERRTKEGRSKKEIIRCLKRYIARELYHDLLNDLTHANSISLLT